MSNRVRILLVALTLALGTSFVTATHSSPGEQAGAQTAALGAKLPVDADVTIGQFPNGLKYVVRVNKLPEKRAELRLVVNAGSLLEDNDQLGLAHFVEHMAFNGTKNFPKLDIVTFMESIGMRFGPSVNAFTSFDETVYMLQVPTDRSGILERSMLILEDWAHNVTFDPVEIDKERGVVIEEWRSRRGADARMQDQQFPVLLKGSRYAERLPIGTKESLETFKHDRLKKYYSDWYRPDLMTVIAVGDFDPAAMQALLTKHFGAIPRAVSPRPTPDYPVPPQPGTLYTVATDKEATGTTVGVYGKMALRDPSTVGAYRQQLVEGVFSGMINARFSELSQKPDAPFLGAGAARGLFVKSAEASMLNAFVKEGEVEKGLTALFAETQRVVRFGFTASELDRQKTNLLRGIERQLAEKDKRPSTQLASEYVRHATQNEPIPGLAYEAELIRRFVPAITLAEVNGLAAEWVPEGNRVVLVNAPDKPGVTVPDEAKLAAAIKLAASMPLTAYTDTVGGQPLLDVIPQPGTVARTSARADFGITEWELSNGVKVVLKPTDFKEDEIVFRAFSPGGTSLASDADFVAADSATTVVGIGGLGKYSNIELRKVLTGKVASAVPSIGELEEGMGGSASKKDLETMFQLIYMRFMQPRADPVIFGVFKTQMNAMLANQTASPEFAFGDMMSNTLYQNHPRRQSQTAEMLKAMDLDKSLAFYKDRFADASDFTFVFVGSLDPAVMKPLVERYLGSLPSLKRKETWKDVGARPARGVIEKRVEKGIEPKSQTSLVFSGPFKYDQEQRVAIRAMSLVLQTRLREALREELGGTYGVSVSASYERIPRQEYTFDIDFGSAPDRADALAKRIFEDIDALKTKGPTEKQVTDVKEGLLRDFETNIKQNGYVLSQLAFKYQLGEDPRTLLDVPSFYHKLTAAAIQQAAKTYLDSANWVKVVLMPAPK